jgi:hypothetical protein
LNRSTSYDRKPRDGDPIRHPTAPVICRRPGCPLPVVDPAAAEADAGEWCARDLAIVVAQRTELQAEREAGKWKHRR